MQKLDLKTPTPANKGFLASLLGSKKAIMTLVGALLQMVVLPVANTKLGLNLSEEAISQSIYPFIAYVLGQGLADFGKEAERQ